MAILSRVQKFTAASVGLITGAVLFYQSNYGSPEFLSVKNSWTTNYVPSVKWDHNWDRRDVKSLVKPRKPRSEEDENQINEELEKNKSKATRHLILIRHGQYNLNGSTDSERYLTDLGKKQAELTGARLAELDLPYTEIVRSTMTRAQETSKIIEKSLPNVPVTDDSLLEEGAPIPPEPPIGYWKSEQFFFRDNPRIEAAFRKYFYRAPASQEKDSYTVLVCHANVIRYFVCRALQFPPEAWLRISLKNGSITCLSIHHNGRVTLRCLGETGHMDPKFLSSS